ncbi:unnamed protein product, partial [Rotaria socialis]
MQSCHIFLISFDDLLDVTHELLAQIGKDDVTTIAQMNVLPRKQLNQMNGWNNTSRDFIELNKHTTLHKLFEEEAEKSCDKIAVVYGDVQLTYRELNEKANQLAHYLRSICDIQPDDLIALFLDKSELMIVSILAVWKSGAAYAPIDPSYPDKRIQFILQDTKAKIVIANKKYMARLHSCTIIKIEIDSIYVTLAGNSNIENPQPIASSDNLALIINRYGSTETTIASHERFYYLGEKRVNQTIGKQIANTSSYVLDKKLNQLPIGAIGELYIGGIGVARGYLNRPELTAERFLPNPFQTDEEKQQGKNARIYKTGDLVRWLRNGELEYLGRNDFQVKIRGLRIELGEIEAVLSSYQGVNRSVVLAKDHKKQNTGTPSTNYLVGYYVSDNDIDESDLKLFMQIKLPDYMIPNRLMRIDKIPVTINGKLDAKALPDIDFSADESNYCTPRNELEVKLCEIWSDILGIEKVGITDDFFRLGGDSIGSLRIVGRIEMDLDLHVSVKDVFECRTIESFCQNVFKKNCNEKIRKLCDIHCYEQEVSNGEVPLLPIQEWFFMKYSTGMSHWNQAFLIETPILDQDRLEDSLIKLIDYHDAFKLRFKRVGDVKYFQYYDDSVNFPGILPFNHLDVSSLGQSENSVILLRDILTKWQSQFDIEKGPLWAIGYLNGFAEGRAQVWFAMHHLIVDTVSWRIICDDLRRLYDGSSNLGKKGSSYGEWSRCVQSYGTRKSMTEGVYWRNLVRNVCYFNDNLSKNSGTSANRLATNA